MESDPADVTRWEYALIDAWLEKIEPEGTLPIPDSVDTCLGSRSNRLEFINKAGREGWELCAILPDFSLLFKRPLGTSVSIWKASDFAGVG